MSWGADRHAGATMFGHGRKEWGRMAQVGVIPNVGEVAGRFSGFAPDRLSERRRPINKLCGVDAAAVNLYR
jgi:hypothetical protein